MNIRSYLVLNQVTLCRDASIGLQWLKRVENTDTGVVLFEQPHRAVVEFDWDIKNAVAASLAPLYAEGYEEIDPSTLKLVAAIRLAGEKDPNIRAVAQ